MSPSITAALLALALTSIASAALVPSAEVQQRSFEYVIKPKVFIISLFRPEAEIWHGIPEFDILAMNITVPGFSPLVSTPLRFAGQDCRTSTGDELLHAAVLCSNTGNAT